MRISLVRAGLFSFLMVMMVIGYLFFSIPRNHIESLKTGYVSIQIVDGVAQYDFTKKKPSFWVSIGKMDHNAIHAILVSEDWKFYQHGGVDWEGMREAAFDVLKMKRFRGASTITQQLIKNLFLMDVITMFRKIQELVISSYMETCLSKERILEIYLNIIEYGQELYGIKNAAEFYFDKHPMFLTTREGAFLAMLLPNPKVYSLSYRRKELSYYAKRTVAEILEKMVVAKYLSEEEYLDEIQKKYEWETSVGEVDNLPAFKF